MFGKKKHKHKWKPMGHTTVKDGKGKEHLRLILICNQCLEAVHVPILSIKQLLKQK